MHTHFTALLPLLPPVQTSRATLEAVGGRRVRSPGFGRQAILLVTDLNLPFRLSFWSAAMKSPLSASTECVNSRNRYVVIILRSAQIQSGDFVSALHVIQEPFLNAQAPDDKLIVGHSKDVRYSEGFTLG